MAEEYDEFDYIPDDLDDENDHQEKKIEESNRENKNKNAKRSDTIMNLNKNTDDEYYKFDTINAKITDSKRNYNNYDEDVEEIKLDDMDGVTDYKHSQKIPSGIVENSLYENNLRKNNLANKVKNLSSIPINDNLNSSTQTNQNNMNISNYEINNQIYKNNSVINKDVYQAKDRSRLETYNNIISSTNEKYNNQLSDKINLSNISQTRTPKNTNSSKNYSYTNIGNNPDVSKNFDESHISNNNGNYYSQIRGDKNKSYLDSVNREISPLNNDFKRGQAANNLTEINSSNINLNNNSYISYKMPSVMDMNSRIIKIGNSNILSKFQYAEMKYDELKNFYLRIQQNFSDRKINELENNYNVDKQKVLEFIFKQNYELRKYIDNLNKIINIVIDASQIPLKNAVVKRNKKIPQPYNNSNINEVNNNKLIEVFRKEHLKLDHRFKQISDSNYEEKLEETLAELKDQINFYETDNKKLKISQKQSEAMFERQYKNNNLTLQTKNLEINKVNLEYENTRRLNDTVLEKIQKNKIAIADNEQKINELSDWFIKLETIGKEMYGITELIDKEDIKKLEKAEKQKNDLKIVMKKKTEVLEKVLITNKKKYEAEIIKNEKSIVNLEKQKMDLMRQIKEKSELSKAVQMKVQQLYYQYDNNLEMFNMNSLDNGDDFTNPKNQIYENNYYKQHNPQINVENVPRNDQNLEMDNSEIDRDLNNNVSSLHRSQVNPNLLTNNPNIVSQKFHNNSNIANSRDNLNEEDKVKLMNGRITNENENINNVNITEREGLENFEKASQIIDVAAFDTQNKKSNKPNFKFNFNSNQINSNTNNKNPITYLENSASDNIKEEKLNKTHNLNQNIKIIENMTKPLNLTSYKNNINDNAVNSLYITDSPDIHLNNSSKININNTNNQALNNNSRINTVNNNINEDISDDNLLKINSRRRNINMDNNKNETNKSNKEFTKKRESEKNINEIKKKEDIPIYSNGKIPYFLANNSKNNPSPYIEKLGEVNQVNPIDNTDKYININESNQKSSTDIYNLESRREKMIGKEKRNILQNMFSDDNDDVIDLGEEERPKIAVKNLENLIDQKKKKAFDNLFKEDENIEIPNNTFKLQMNRGNDNNSQKRSLYNENDNLNTKNSITKKNEKPKDILDELEDIVL